jgi:hypothetical protein
MEVEIAPGPESMGMARGVMAMSSLAIPSWVSSAVSWSGERLALSMSRAERRRISPPAIWKAGRVIPKSRKILGPMAAKEVITVAQVKQAVRAIRRLASGESRAVMARKAGMAAKGSTIAKRDPKVSRAYSSMAGKNLNIFTWIGPRKPGHTFFH